MRNLKKKKKLLRFLPITNACKNFKNNHIFPNQEFPRIVFGDEEQLFMKDKILNYILVNRVMLADNIDRSIFKTFSFL